MAALGQHAVAANPSGTHVTTLSTGGVTTAATGSTFVIFVAITGGATISATPTDSFGNTYTLTTSLTGFFFASENIYAYTCINGAGGAAHTATAVPSASTAMAVGFVELTGVGSIDVSNSLNNGNSASTSAPGASVTTTNANDLILSFIALSNGGGSTISDSAVWNSLFNNSNPAGADATIQSCASSYQVETSTGTFSDTYTLSPANNSGGLTIAFKAAAPIINAQPVAATAASGSTATFSVTATSSGGSLSYQWQTAAITSLYANVPGTWGNVSSGGTSSSYTTPTLSSADNGTWFRVTVTDSNASVTSVPVRLWITGQPSAGKGRLLDTAWAREYHGRRYQHSASLPLKQFNFAADKQISSTVWPLWFFGAGLVPIAGSPGAYSWSGTTSTLGTGGIAGVVGTYSWAGTTASTSSLISASVGAYSWAGKTATTSGLINASVGAYGWTGTTSATTELINAGIGAYSWAGTTSTASGLINQGIGAYTWSGTTSNLSGPTNVAGIVGAYIWAGTTATASQLIGAAAGTYSWSGTTATTNQEIDGVAGAYNWSGTTAQFRQLLLASTGAYTWVGTTSTLGAGAISASVGAYTWSGTSSDVPTQISSDPTFGYVWSGSTSGVFDATGASSASVGAGRRRRSIYRITIDGQVFECRSLDEALQLLAKAKETAKRLAEDQAIWALKIQSESPIAIAAPRIEPPKITVSSRDLRAAANQAKREIARTYAKEMQNAEIRMLMELSKRQADDDESLILLM